MRHWALELFSTLSLSNNKINIFLSSPPIQHNETFAYEWNIYSMNNIKKAICIYAVSLFFMLLSRNWARKKRYFQFILRGNCMEKCWIFNAHQVQDAVAGMVCKNKNFKHLFFVSKKLQQILLKIQDSIYWLFFLQSLSLRLQVFLSDI